MGYHFEKGCNHLLEPIISLRTSSILKGFFLSFESFDIKNEPFSGLQVEKGKKVSVFYGSHFMIKLQTIRKKRAETLNYLGEKEKAQIFITNPQTAFLTSDVSEHT